MKTLYESILKSVGAGAYHFNLGDLHGANSSQSYTGIFNMASIRRELENYHSVITRGMKDGRLIAELLCTFIFTPKEWKTLTKDYFENDEVDTILKEKFAPFIRKNINAKFSIDSTCLEVKFLNNDDGVIYNSSIVWWKDIKSL